MYKRILALITTLLMVISLAPSAVYASEKKEITISEKRAEEIEELYAERAKLALDFINNADEIKTIDQRIARLGAKTISSNQVDYLLRSEKRNGAELKGHVQSGYGIQWTSYRTKTNVAGTVYELEIFTGVPSAPNSVLTKTVLNYPQTPKATYSAVGELVFSLGCAGISSINGYSPIVSLSAIARSALGLVTVPSYVTVSGVGCAIFTGITTTMKYVFVKYDGSPDSGQILMYKGNSSLCNAGFNIGYNKQNSDGSFTAEVDQFTSSFTVKSTGYDDYYTMCRNYHNYKSQGTDFENFWLLFNCNLSYQYKKNGTVTNIKDWRISLPVDY